MQTYTFHTIEQNDSTECWHAVKNTNTIEADDAGEPTGTKLHRDVNPVHYHHEIEALKATVLPMLDYVSEEVSLHITRDAKGKLRIDSVPVSLLGLDHDTQKALAGSDVVVKADDLNPSFDGEAE